MKRRMYTSSSTCDETLKKFGLISMLTRLSTPDVKFAPSLGIVYFSNWNRKNKASCNMLITLYSPPFCVLTLTESSMFYIFTITHQRKSYDIDIEC